MKKTLSALLAAVLLLLPAVPSAAAAKTAVRPQDAASYLDKVNTGRQYPNSYLADFDGDGSDELLLVNPGDGERTFEVWKGSECVVQDHVYDSLTLCTKKGKVYLKRRLNIVGDSEYDFLTLVNGEWVNTNQMAIGFYESDFDEQQFRYFDNKKEITKKQFDAKMDTYETLKEIPTSTYWGDVHHTAAPEILNALTPQLPGMPDVLPGLSSGDRKALFDDLLFYIFGLEFDVQARSEAEFRTFTTELAFETLIPLPQEECDPSYDAWEVSEQTLTTFLKQNFGRVPDYEQYSLGRPVTMEDAGDMLPLYYDGVFYYANPGMGAIPYQVTHTAAHHLYDLGGGYYLAQYLVEDSHMSLYLHAAVVSRNDNGTWCLHRLFASGKLPTAADLKQWSGPSSWAAEEIKAADAAGIIPALSGKPSWREASTRLQFAEMIVNMVEKITGEPITPASEGTFTDCDSLAVRKANAAGIIGGVGDHIFAPDSMTNREQIAAMIYRSIRYLEQETGKNLAPAASSMEGFADAASVSDWAREGVGSLAANRIMSGTSSTTLSPKAACSIEQSLLLIYRLFLKA